MNNETDEKLENPIPEGNAGETRAGDEQSPGEKIQLLEDQIAELQDQYLRKAAEFENFRKRMTREKQEAIEFANQNLLMDLIPILDDFDRAIKTGEAAVSPPPEYTSLLEGVSMTEKRLLSQLEIKWGLKRYDAAGEIFDPNKHEAIMMDKSPDVTESMVQEEFIKGYALKDRIIRSAKVKVLMPENPGARNAGDENAAQEE